MAYDYTVDVYKILSETYGTNTLIYSYDENDSVSGIKYNGTQYYFGRICKAT